MSESMILQMMGRAGRQQYNKTGRVYIMTRREKVVKKLFIPISKQGHF